MGLFNFFKNKEKKQEAPQQHDHVIKIHTDLESFGRSLNDPEYDDQRKKVIQYWKDDVDENDDFSMSKKEILDSFSSGEKIWKFDLLQIPYQTEEFKNEQNRKRIMIKAQAGDEWIPIGTLRSDLKAIHECIESENKKPHLFLGGGPYKQIVGSWDDESVETFPCDRYFYFEYFKPVKEKDEQHTA